MAEFEEKLNAILGDQEAMGQIMALARSLSGGEENRENSGDSDSNAPEESEPNQTDQSASQSEGRDMSDLLGQLDPEMIQMGMRLLQEYRGTDDRSAALLHALRPFLREERRAKLDKALQIARVTRLVRVALSAMGKRGEEGDV